MSIEKIGLAQQNFTSMNVNNTKTMSVPFEGQPDDKSKKVKTAVLAGLGALGAVGVAMFAIKRGKVNKALSSLDDFKASGNKLVKGKAVKANGKPYTGIISHVNKDGTKIYMEYENGILKSSTKFKLPNAGSGALPPEGYQYVPKIEDCVYKKEFNYDENGKLISVVRCKPAPARGIRIDDSDIKSTYGLVKDKTFDIKKMQNVGKQRGLLRAIGNEPILDSNLANGYQVFKHNADKIPGMEKVKSYEDFLKALDLEETDVKNGKFTNEAKKRLKKLLEKQGTPETFTWNELMEYIIKERQQGPEIKTINEVVNKKFLPPSNEGTKSVIPGAYKNANLKKI